MVFYCEKFFNKISLTKLNLKIKTNTKGISYFPEKFLYYILPHTNPYSKKNNTHIVSNRILIFVLMSLLFIIFQIKNNVIKYLPHVDKLHDCIIKAKKVIIIF